ncbi:glutathione S-transferase family protein [Antarctobacter jejuensis]|uniref:glutathione S-transferase family protein n=1 Tax=Antarctobacter jejuensis TaxID=1439938 RepID=UPI003FD4B4D6
MLTLYHAPFSRSSRVVELIHALGAQDRVRIRLTEVPRQDGSGARDPENPHPDGKVPLLDHDGTVIRESDAIMIHLTNLFPEAGLAPKVGTPEHGAFLAWMAWYGNVMEPVVVTKLAELSHPILQTTYRDWETVLTSLETALDGADWLMGEAYSAADVLICSTFNWLPDLVPDVPVIRDWVARCQAQAAHQAAMEFDQRAMAAAA